MIPVPKLKVSLIVMVTVLLFFALITSLVSAQEGLIDLAKIDPKYTDYGISRSACSEEFCLLSVWNDEKMDGRLLKYDGVSLTDLTSQVKRGEFINIKEIIWTGSYWFISVRSRNRTKSRGIWDEFAYWDYDGTTFFNLFEKVSVKAIGWNGEYLLIGTGPTPRLFKYDGKKIEEVDIAGATYEEFFVENRPSHSYAIPKAIGWNGEYWLISGTIYRNETFGREPRLFKYDGNLVTKINVPGHVFQIFDRENSKLYEICKVIGLYSSPGIMGWNGEYWLMDTGYSLVEYDGERFRATKYGTCGPRKATPKKLFWTDEYWIIEYSSFDPIIGKEISSFVKYLGAKHIGTTPQTLTEEEAHLALEAGGIEFPPPFPTATLRPVKATPTSTNTPPTTPQSITTPPETGAAAPPEKGICGPSLILLITLLPLFLFHSNYEKR